MTVPWHAPVPPDPAARIVVIMDALPREERFTLLRWRLARLHRIAESTDAQPVVVWYALADTLKPWLPVKLDEEWAWRVLAAFYGGGHA